MIDSVGCFISALKHIRKFSSVIDIRYEGFMELDLSNSFGIFEEKYELRHEKTCILHVPKQRRRLAAW